MYKNRVILIYNNQNESLSMKMLIKIWLERNNGKLTNYYYFLNINNVYTC